MSESNAPKTAVVVATYNERENIERLVPILLSLPVSASVIVVDDGSPDGTAEGVRKAGENSPGRVDLIERSGKLGYGSAFVEGFRRALESGFEQIVSRDAEFSHDPESIPGMIESLQDADMVIGSRYVGGIRILNWTMSRLLLSCSANRYINTILRFKLTDCTSGFRAYRAEVLRSIDLDRAGSRGYAFLVEILEMVTRKKFKVAEFPIVYTERQAGRSKMSHGVILEAVFRPWQLLFGRMFTRS